MAEPATALPDVSAPPDGVSASLGLKDVTSRMADNQREKIAAEDKVISKLDATIDKSLPQIEQLSKNAGVEAEKLKPWDADAEAAKRRTDPIEAFGSFGSVFGILASAFTHAPMENALNASSAAMNAIKENDNKSYDRAHKAWEDNLKMTMDRHTIQHQAYQDATALLSTNMQAAQTKLQVLAARFGDKQVQTLLDAGMNKEVEELLQARQRNALALQEQMPRIVEENAKISRLFALGYDTKNPTSEKSQEALQKFKQEQSDQKAAERAYTPEQQAYAQFIKENPKATPEERSDYIQSLRARAKNLTPEQTAINSYIEQNPDATAEQLRDFVTNLRRESRGPSNITADQNQQKIDLQKSRQEEDARHKQALEDIANGKGDVAKQRADEIERHNRAMEGISEKKASAAGGAKDLTTDRQRAQDVAEFRKALRAEEDENGKPKWTTEQIADKAARYEHDLKTKAAAPSGNKVDDIKSRENKITIAESTIDKIDDMLLKHKAISGIGGKITRTGEAVGNIIGSSATDRAQFRRWVLELQETLPSVINDRNGRPLSSEASKIEGIIAGLAAGDTNANTLRAYDELRPLLQTIKKQLQERRGESAPAEDPKPSHTPSWKDAPEVK